MQRKFWNYQSLYINFIYLSRFYCSKLGIEFQYDINMNANFISLDQWSLLTKKY